MCKLSAQDFTVAMRWVRQICLPTWEVELEAAGNNGAIRSYLRALRGLLRRARWLGRLHKYAPALAYLITIAEAAEIALWLAEHVDQTDMPPELQQQWRAAAKPLRLIAELLRPSAQEMLRSIGWEEARHA